MAFRKWLFGLKNGCILTIYIALCIRIKSVTAPDLLYSIWNIGKLTNANILLV
jgi:hypothetical protein